MWQFPEAFWTASTAYAAWCALALNTFGLIVLVRQLRLTEIAADAARLSADAASAGTKIALAQSRPWITVDVADQAVVVIGKDRDRLMMSIKATIRNVGKTPALLVIWHMIPVLKTDDESLARALAEFGARDEGTATTLFPEEERAFTGGRWIAVGPKDHIGMPHALCAVEYRSTVGGERHWTQVLVAEFPFSLEPPEAGRRDIGVVTMVQSCLQPT